MAKFPNQSSVKICKNEIEKPYAVISEVSALHAMNNLKNDAFKLWYYLVKNQNNFEFNLSQKACEEWGIKKDGYYRAKEELQRQGYLVKDEEDNFIFFDEPCSSE